MLTGVFEKADQTKVVFPFHHGGNILHRLIQLGDGVGFGGVLEVFGDIAKFSLRILGALGDESTDGGDMHELFAEAAHVGMSLVVVLIFGEILGHTDHFLVDVVPGP